MKVIITDNKQIKSRYDSELFILHTEYFGLFNRELVMEHFHKVEEFAQSNRIDGSIADFTKLSGSYNRILDYLKSKGFPSMKKMGLKAVALVISDDIMISYLTEKLTEIIKNEQIKVKIFKTSDKALSWMLNAINH